MKKQKYSNLQLSKDYWNERKKDFDYMNYSNKQKNKYRIITDKIKNCKFNLANFYWKNNGKLAKLNVKDISPHNSKLIEEILKEKLGKPEIKNISKNKNNQNNFFLNLSSINKLK